MAAYVIVDIEVTDPERYEEYKAPAARTVAAHGGKYIVRGNPVEVLEGGWKPSRLVILRFESAAQARRWWSSEDYRIPKQLRQATAKSKMIVVEGI